MALLLDCRKLFVEDILFFDSCLRVIFKGRKGLGHLFSAF